MCAQRTSIQPVTYPMLFLYPCRRSTRNSVEYLNPKRSWLIAVDPIASPPKTPSICCASAATTLFYSETVFMIGFHRGCRSKSLQRTSHEHIDDCDTWTK